MNRQDYTGYIHSTSEQAQSHGQVQSGSERAQSHGQVQFGSGQVKSHGQSQSHGQAQSHGQVQSSASSMAVQMLKNKNKPVDLRSSFTDLRSSFTDKERQKIELEKSIESIRRFNQINEEIKETYDKHNAKLKQRKEDMRESLRKVEAKYYPDLDPRSGYDKDKDKNKDVDSDKDEDSDKDKDSDLDSFDDFVYVQKLKTNRIRCEECDEEMTRKNYNRHIQSLKHKKNERMYNRNKIIESANEDGIKVTNEDKEQKLDEQYIEEGIKFCDSCDMYLDNNTAYNKHVTKLKHGNNVRLVTGEIWK